MFSVQLIQLLEMQGVPRLLCHKGTILPATKTYLSTTLNISLCINLESHLWELSLEWARATQQCSSPQTLGPAPQTWPGQPRAPAQSSRMSQENFLLPIVSYSVCSTSWSTHSSFHIWCAHKINYISVYSLISCDYQKLCWEDKCHQFP